MLPFHSLSVSLEGSPVCWDSRHLAGVFITSRNANSPGAKTYGISWYLLVLKEICDFLKVRWALVLCLWRRSHQNLPLGPLQTRTTSAPSEELLDLVDLVRFSYGTMVVVYPGCLQKNIKNCKGIF